MHNLPLINIAALHVLIAQGKSVVLIDATIDKVNQRIDADGATPELIPDSVFMDIEEKFSDHSNPLPHTFVDAAKFEKEAQALGINRDSILVIYDRWGVYSSPRAWWMFRAMGHENTFVLQGGLPAWKEQHLPIVSKHLDTATLPHGNFIANPQPNFWKSKAEILKGLKDQENTIIDARSASRFAGTSQEPRAGLRSGHIPGAQNLPFDQVLSDIQYKDSSALKAIFDPLIGEKPVVFSCGSGISAAIIALAAYQLGYEDLAIYDGSWAEWGADENVPVERD
ncbi:sulfurtransferase [Sphingobacterium sp. lm-10]|uniref:sulfurtransferase n=1 Tax=Sphingobacterium sp. lm-10 TaxID=2944904 RepID=UPI00202231E6|nr:sulfurtransferase [Sphingobacterium sp. lm-10]MCL7989317.1 sulfurtransferase [Sphingobacterium sp. lm-10]